MEINEAVEYAKAQILILDHTKESDPEGYKPLKPIHDSLAALVMEIDVNRNKNKQEENNEV